MLKLWLAPVQPFSIGVTVMVPTPTAPAVKLILPMPLAARPMAVLLFTQLKVGVLVPVKLAVTSVPEQTVWLAGSVTVGAGLMTIVNVNAMPMQVPMTGVTLMVAVCWVLTPAAIKLRSPVPVAARPMAGLEFVQLKVAPAVPVKAAMTLAFAQATILLTGFTVGAGVTVMVKFCWVPVQPFAAGVTVKLPVVGAPTLAAIKLMFPVPLAPSPIAILEFVQLKIGFPVPLKGTVTVAPEQTVWLGGSATVGIGFTVMV